MKKLFSNKFVIAGVIIAASLAIYWHSTYNNKTWLAKQILLNGGASGSNVDELSKKSTSELRAMLKTAKSAA